MLAVPRVARRPHIRMCIMQFAFFTSATCRFVLGRWDRWTGMQAHHELTIRPQTPAASLSVFIHALRRSGVLDVGVTGALLCSLCPPIPTALNLQVITISSRRTDEIDTFSMGCLHKLYPGFKFDGPRYHLCAAIHLMVYNRSVHPTPLGS